MEKKIRLVVELELTGNFDPTFDILKYAKIEVPERLHSDQHFSQNSTRIRVTSIKEKDQEEDQGLVLPPSS